jgi:hypothetical protein
VAEPRGSSCTHFCCPSFARGPFVPATATKELPEQKEMKMKMNGRGDSRVCYIIEFWTDGQVGSRAGSRVYIDREIDRP